MADEYEIRALGPTLGTTTSRATDADHGETGLCMDESAFRMLYEQTAAPLFRYLLAMTRARDVAEDVLQETYCRFLTSRPSEMNGPQVRSYLFRIATNLLRDRWRRSKEDQQSADPIETASPPLYLERALGVRQAFERLKPRERQLLWLAYVEGSNHQEIANCTGIGSASIRILLFRARHKLAELISKSAAKPEVSK